jgi:NAD(P)-dependent dehydrogenase (short-subunit alcohol dehydrogenase family)
MPITPSRSDALASHYRGKTAIVTGAASGIGKAVATALVQNGALCVFADIDEDGAAAAAAAAGRKSPTGGGGTALAAALDVTDAGEVTDLVARTAREHKSLDLVFNNAGVNMLGAVSDFSLVHWRRVIEVNLMGVVHGVAAAYPIMIEQGGGHIVNTASMAGLLPSPMLAPYGMTKHGIVGLSLSLRIEAAAHAVRVSVVCPGVIDTPILHRGNPPEVPAVPAVPDVPTARALLEKLIGKAYSPEDLAGDILAGVATNRALIVAPASARRAWRIFRLAPELLVSGGTFTLRRELARLQRYGGSQEVDRTQTPTDQ